MNYIFAIFFFTISI